MVNLNSMTDEYIRDLLECPVCMETIDSVPVYECANGHAICKVCIEKLNKCPICKNDSAPVRSLKLENIVQKVKGIQPENVEPITATPRQATPRQATPRQATPREARRESRILMNNRINDQDAPCDCNLFDLCGSFCIVIGLCLLLFFSFLLYGSYRLINDFLSL